jgi:tetratricopeptide (TPR) repeat protein
VAGGALASGWGGRAAADAISPRWRLPLTAAALLVALLSGWIFARIASDLTDNARGILLYERGRTGEAWRLVAGAAEGSWLQSKPWVDLGDLAVWGLGDEAFREEAGFGDPWSLARVAFLSYAEGLSRQPANPRAWAGLAELFRQTRLLRVSEGAIDLSLIEEGGPPLFDAEDDLVAAAYGKAIDLEPDNFFYHAYLGVFYEDRGFHAQAIDAWARAVEIMPELSWHYYLPARQMPADLYEAIGAALTRAVDSNPAVAAEKIYMNMGDLAERAGDVKAALHHYRDAAALAQDPSVHLYMEGSLLYNERRFVEAERILADAAARGTLQPGPLGLSHTLIGRCRMKAGDGAGAIASFERARRANPDAWYIASDLAAAYEKEGRIDRAESEYRATIRLAPDRASGYSALIGMYRRTRQFSKAIPLAEQLVEIFPGNSVFQDQLDALHRELGRPEAD